MDKKKYFVKVVCLICQETIGIFKENQISCHFSTMHADYACQRLLHVPLKLTQTSKTLNTHLRISLFNHKTWNNSVFIKSVFHYKIHLFNVIGYKSICNKNDSVTQQFAALSFTVSFAYSNIQYMWKTNISILYSHQTVFTDSLFFKQEVG